MVKSRFYCEHLKPRLSSPDQQLRPMETNPYLSPSSDPFGGSSFTSAEGVTDLVLTHLRRTKGWVKFIAIMAFIGAVLMLGGGVMMMIMGIFSGAAFGAMGGAEMGLMGGFSGVLGIGLGVLYAAMGALYFYPGLKLWKYGTRIDALLLDRSPDTLALALNEQRAFWKFTGVMIIVMLILYVVALVAIIGLGVFGAAAAGGFNP